MPSRQRHTSEAGVKATSEAAVAVASSLPESERRSRVNSSTTTAPEGWAPEDAASYWRSQVELTTYLEPLRHIWMGPQFVFCPYPFDVSWHFDTRECRAFSQDLQIRLVFLF